ncbi:MULTISPECIES: PucR family transcriptional regulator [Nocardiaceae]|uniref:PucR family transcriptional regulator n=1 Tax=Nocardiaceae TaxID=85025 RepID=UPI0015F46489|nr:MULTISPECIES: helix-turn-helix domain-containing protein [Rhodococcus]
MERGQLQGGAAGLEHMVSDSCVVTPASLDAVQKCSIVFLTSTDTLEAELALPRLREQDAAIVVVNQDVLLSTQWLSDRLDLPLLRLDSRDLLAVALQAKVHLRHQDVDHGLVCSTVARRLVRSGETPAAVVRVLTAQLSCAITIVGLSSVVLAGAPLPVDLRIDLHAPRWIKHGDLTYIVVPSPQTKGPVSQICCVIHAPGHTQASRMALYEDAAQLAVLRLAAWSAQSALAAAWDQASQGALLTQLIDTEELSGVRAQQALALGWKVDGYHAAVVIRPESVTTASSHPAEILFELQRSLSQRGFSSPTIPFGDGWVWWITEPVEPQPASVRAKMKEINQLLRSLQEYELVAGLSLYRIGVRGLAHSISEAGKLARLAGRGPGRRVLETAEGSSPRQFVLAAVTDELAHRRAHMLLQPLLEPKQQSLIDTLNIYLLNECSTTATSAQLGLHRNSVIKRLVRIESILQVDLSDSDTRLALRLACKAL